MIHVSDNDTTLNAELEARQRAQITDTAYKRLRFLLRHIIWRGELVNKENLPPPGPALFISNHLGPLGPIACAVELPQRIATWSVPEMVDPRACAEYMRWDFVERDLHLHQPLSGWVSTGLSRIVVPLLRGIGCIPAYKGNNEHEKQLTLGLSLSVLLANRPLLIFPEYPNADVLPGTQIHRFSKSYLWLVDLYYAKTGQALAVSPLVAHPSRKLQVLPPEYLTPAHFTREKNRDAWSEDFETRIYQAYLALNAKQPSSDK